ncbi:hypothetical protein, partial [Streptomyces halstedii]|uniref:hypothetical protein n=1 Tax=Streptomyces halstedii TaxID=1944 RepID=UPI0033BC12AF
REAPTAAPRLSARASMSGTERRLGFCVHPHLLLVLYYSHGILLSGTTVHEFIQGLGRSARDRS